MITGGAGFIGNNFVPYFLGKYPNYRIINLDLLTYAGNLENLKEVDDILDHSKLKIRPSEATTPQERGQNSKLQNDRYYHFVKGDICNRELLEFIFEEYDIQGVIHFAAESHVDNSIKNPGVFVETNVNGTFTLLNVAYKHWMEGPFKYRKRYLNGKEKNDSTLDTRHWKLRFHVFTTSPPTKSTAPCPTIPTSSSPRRPPTLRTPRTRPAKLPAI